MRRTASFFLTALPYLVPPPGVYSKACSASVARREVENGILAWLQLRSLSFDSHSNPESGVGQWHLFLFTDEQTEAQRVLWIAQSDPAGT